MKAGPYVSLKWAGGVDQMIIEVCKTCPLLDLGEAKEIAVS